MNSPLEKRTLKSVLINNNVTILFVVLCVIFYFASGTTLTFLLPELFTRIGRNTFMVLSLLIPVTAGLGLNFSIVIGAIAAQIAIFLVMLWGSIEFTGAFSFLNTMLTGFPGLISCVILCTPLAIFFGWLVGRLFNSMKGAEMIGGLVTGYFSDGLYQLLFLFVLGGIIPINNKTLMISTGVGVKNAINLTGTLKYALDNVAMISIIDFAFWVTLAGLLITLIYRLVKKQPLKPLRLVVTLVAALGVYGLTFIPPVTTFLSTTRLLLLNAIEIGVLAAVVYNLYKIIRGKAVDKEKGFPTKRVLAIAIAAVIYALTYVPALYNAFVAVRLPVLTYLIIGGLCVFTNWFMGTKLGHEMRTVGQSRTVANSAGINVDRTRIIALVISTVLASYGQLISLQNLGTVATYGSHNQVGLYAIAALLVGGASVHQANWKQAILGIVLFHTLFILSPLAGKALFGNAQIGEYFRVFVAYGVIAVSLAMHAWKINAQRKAASNTA